MVFHGFSEFFLCAGPTTRLASSPHREATKVGPAKLESQVQATLAEPGDLRKNTGPSVRRSATVRHGPPRSMVAVIGGK